jgi:hypothetical protein
MSREDRRNEHVDSFTARLAEYALDHYIENDLERARDEGRAEALGKTLFTSRMALTEEGRKPAQGALGKILEELHEKHPLGTRVRVTVEIVHRQPGERGGPEDL